MDWNRLFKFKFYPVSLFTTAPQHDRRKMLDSTHLLGGRDYSGRAVAFENIVLPGDIFSKITEQDLFKLQCFLTPSGIHKKQLLGERASVKPRGREKTFVGLQLDKTNWKKTHHSGTQINSILRQKILPFKILRQKVYKRPQPFFPVFRTRRTK